VVQVDTLGGQPPTAPSHRRSFEVRVDNQGHVYVVAPSVDPWGANGDYAPTMYSNRQSDIGQAFGDAFAAQLPLRQDEIDAVRNRLQLPESVSFVAADKHGTPLLTPEQKQALQLAGKVWLAGYSSTGGGHTKRMLEPLLRAVNQGDVVVLNLPLPWRHDKGAAARTLSDYLGKLHKKGVTTIISQNDRTITGLYTESGQSANVEILQNFVDKVNPPKVIDKDILGNEGVPAFAADDLVSQVADAAGDKNKVKSFSDMDPYLTTAAEKADIPTRTEIGNHQIGLGVPSLNDQGIVRWDGFLRLATAGSQTDTGLVQYSEHINPLVDMMDTLGKMKIDKNTSAVNAHQRAIQTLFERGVHLPLDGKQSATPGVLVARGATPAQLDSMVFLYVNEYTPGVVQHIKNELANPDSPYRNSLFLVAGREAMQNPNEDPNALHVAYIHGNGLMNAGYGTTSEAYYLNKVGGYRGKVVVMPVEHQHEQEQNAEVMRQLMGDSVQVAKTPRELISRLNELMQSPTRTSDLRGVTMHDFVTALENDFTMHQHLANLAAGTRSMETREERLNALSQDPISRNDALTQRRLLYLVWPALEATVTGKTSFSARVGRNFAPEDFANLAQLADVLANPSELRRVLHLKQLGVRQAPQVLDYFRQVLSNLLATPHTERSSAAKAYQDELGERFTLGY
jgi:hypothetical protein